MQLPPPINRSKSALTAAFTLIEISVVLVIIGLIVGGVLVGQELIVAATMRSQITQIEKYNTAVNTFRGKYGYLPGDIPDPQASQFGFLARGTTAGEGDGNGIIEGRAWGTPSCGPCSNAGEATMFWVDLSTAGFIDGGFNTATSTSWPPALSDSRIGLYLPQAKVGNGNYIYIWSGGYTSGYPWGGGSYVAGGDGQNYYGLSAVTNLDGAGAVLDSAPNLPVRQAYNIDSKIDDGLPQSGKVRAIYEYGNGMLWAVGNGGSFNNVYVPSLPGSAIAPSSFSCMDNNSNPSNQTQYSMTQSGGNGLNCALSFRFQ